MTYYEFHASDFLTQTKMADGDDVIRKACENFSLHLKYPLILRPEQHQAVEATFQLLFAPAEKVIDNRFLDIY